MNDEPKPPDKRSFLLTLPGILTQVAALITAITALLALFFRQGHSGDLAVPKPAPSPTTSIPLKVSARVYFDSKTGLMWTIRDNGTDVTWWQADDHARQLTFGGYTDWRLPTIDELEELNQPPVGIRTPFTVHGLIWSSTKSGPDHAMFFNFWAGLPGSDPLESMHRAFCVRNSEE
jgi:uncharacterized protein DUF1566